LHIFSSQTHNREALAVTITASPFSTSLDIVGDGSDDALDTLNALDESNEPVMQVDERQGDMRQCF
jgi:hypothetical protein